MCAQQLRLKLSSEALSTEDDDDGHRLVHRMGSTCAATPTASSSALTVSSPAQLARPTPSSYISRSGSKLVGDNGQEFRIVGANVYWLGLDENVQPNPSWPAKDRVLEAMAIVSTMGGTVIRSTSLGVSVGTPLSVEPSLGVFNQEAFDAIDFALFAARSYGLRLILPLTDEYNYYHGGFGTFLGWRGLATDNSAAFYDTTGQVFADFETYVGTLLNHTSNYTSLAMKDDPTILAFELGNELSSPPASWSSAVSTLIRSLSPNALIAGGSYGVTSDDLSVSSLDIVSNHYYASPSGSDYSSDAKKAHVGGKAFYAGEFDWTGRTRDWHPFLWLVLPLVLTIAAAVVPPRFFPWRIPLPWKKKTRRWRGGQETAHGKETPLDELPDSSKRLVDPTYVQPLPSPSYPFASTPAPARRTRATFNVRKWPLVGFLALWIPLSFVIIWFCAPASLDSFLGGVESSAYGSGDLYWSLFGRDQQCCNYVEHDDGFTLHYPGTTDDMRTRVLKLTRHAYAYTSRSLLGTGTASASLTEAELPTVRCPQESSI